MVYSLSNYETTRGTWIICIVVLLVIRLWIKIIYEIVWFKNISSCLIYCKTGVKHQTRLADRNNFDITKNTQKSSNVAENDTFQKIMVSKIQT